MSLCLGMMAFDAVFYLILAWYFESVLPTQFGAPRHPLFFLSPLMRPFNYFRTDVKTVPTSVANPQSLEDGEPVSALMGEPAVRVIDLVKDYGSSYFGSSKSRPAVDGLNFDLFAGQVTCLLGHNGAGKSTTI